MPKRVISFDLEAYVPGIKVLAAVGRPYNPQGLPGRWRGGRYVDCLVQIQEGTVLPAEVWEATSQIPSRAVEGGHGHTFLGWLRPENPPEDVTRFSVVTVELGALLGHRAENVDFVRDDSNSLVEAEVNTRIGGPSNGSTLHPHAWDALDDHPERLKRILRRCCNRRRTSSDSPVTWRNRRRNR